MPPTLIEPHPLMLLPFAAMLLCMALLPSILRHHWERYYHWVAIALAVIPIGYYALILREMPRLLREGRDYFSFIALIGSLFVVTGGIHIGVHGRASALKNSLFLFGGALLANVIGTTGASVLLIRPWIRLNRGRYRALHTAFFIFIVSNVGGGLTPLGPPLLLGYLKGVPFWWPTIHCWKPWLLALAALLIIFFALDSFFCRKHDAVPRTAATKKGRLPYSLQGRRNLWFLAIILAALFVSRPPLVREMLMLITAGASYYFTPRSLHQLNAFSFRPIEEVAWLFFGIFATMVPVIDYMQAHAHALPLSSPGQFFCLAGGLSSVLDNAPTYLTFLASALGQNQLSIENPADVAHFLQSEPLTAVAISMGAVFFGALTYIGNGPNFLVKATVQQSRHAAPGFFGFLAWSLPVFAPVLGLVWFFTFR